MATFCQIPILPLPETRHHNFNPRIQIILVLEYTLSNQQKLLMERRKAFGDDLKYVARTLARQAELSQQTLRTLAESSSTVNSTDEEYQGIGSLLNQSKVILTKYGRREFTDKILIYAAVIFFYSCVAYVVCKRSLFKFFYY